MNQALFTLSPIMNETNSDRVSALQKFEKSRRRATVNQLAARLTGRDTRLLPFDAVRQKLRHQNPMYIGVREVPLAAIVGSVGRYREFNRQFLPLSDSLKERWITLVNLAGTSGWPPIELYQVGNIYFVRDGNHRTSVARHLGMETIEAHVWEFPESLNIDLQENSDQIFIQLGEKMFMEKTNLNALYPDHSLHFTSPGQYTELLCQISDLQQTLSDIDGEPMSYEETVRAWYEMMYLPTEQIIRDSTLLADFPGRTEADLFVWLSKYRYHMREVVGDFQSLTELAEILAERYREGGVSRLSRQVKRFLGGEQLPPLEEEGTEGSD